MTTKVNVSEHKDAKNNVAKQMAQIFNRADHPLWLNHASVLIALIVCEAIWYLPIIRKVGFYLDDWSTYANLQAVQQNWLSLLKTSLADSRIITRPIEALVYVSSWLAFHDQVYWHHLLNCVFEIASAFCLYLILSRLSNNKPLSFIASMLMLVYPNHDATHYWVTANTINLALGLYLFSLWQSIKLFKIISPFVFYLPVLLFL